MTETGAEGGANMNIDTDGAGATAMKTGTREKAGTRREPERCMLSSLALDICVPSFGEAEEVVDM